MPFKNTYIESREKKLLNWYTVCYKKDDCCNFGPKKYGN